MLSVFREPKEPAAARLLSSSQNASAFATSTTRSSRKAAAKGGISPGDVADEEKRKSALSRLAGEFGRAAVPDSYGIAAMSIRTRKSRRKRFET